MLQERTAVTKKGNFKIYLLRMSYFLLEVQRPNLRKPSNYWKEAQILISTQVLPTICSITPNLILCGTTTTIRLLDFWMTWRLAKHFHLMMSSFKKNSSFIKWRYFEKQVRKWTKILAESVNGKLFLTSWGISHFFTKKYKQHNACRS